MNFVKSFGAGLAFVLFIILVIGLPILSAYGIWWIALSLLEAPRYAQIGVAALAITVVITWIGHDVRNTDTTDI